MSYEKHHWGAEKTTQNVITPGRLRNLETQHELALVDARVNNTELIAQLASTAPAGEQAMIYFDTGDNKLYGHDGAEWVLLGVSN